MKPGDLIRYKHNGKAGIILRIDPGRGYPHKCDTHLVLWSRESGGKVKWFVSPEWIERFEDDEGR